jgi:hypothetical protein
VFLPFGQLDFFCLESGCRGPLPSYYLGLILQSQIAGVSADMSGTGTDASEVQLTGVEVWYRFPQIEAGLPDELSSFSPPLATDSLPGGGRAAIIVEVINPVQAQSIYDFVVESQGGVFPGSITLEVTVVFTAERSGNSKGGVGEIESRDYTFPIRLCVGCLVTCSTCEGGECPPNPEDLEWIGGVCGNAQDGLIAPSVCGVE